MVTEQPSCLIPAMETSHTRRWSGKTWARIDGTGTNVLPTNVGRIALSIAPSSPSTLYAGFQDAYSYNLLGFFKTIDGGANWVKPVNTPDYCAGQCWYDQ